jgi:hypothetical protein
MKKSKDSIKVIAHQEVLETNTENIDIDHMKPTDSIKMNTVNDE